MELWQWYLLSTGSMLLSIAFWLTNLVGLPGNWLVVVMAAAIASLATPPATMPFGWVAVTVLITLAALGELIEFVAGAAGAAQRGASRRSVALSIVGTFVGGLAGAIVGLPIPVIGSLVASLFGGALGAFAGAYIGEHTSRKTATESFAAGKGAFVGRLWGAAGKLCVGAAMLVAMAVSLLS